MQTFYTMHRIAVALVLLFALYACGEQDAADQTERAAGAVSADSDSDAPENNVTAQYLEGAWCYAYWESMGESEEPNFTYIFKPDGSLLYQHTPGDEVDKPGSWELDGDRLKILPKFMAFNPKIKTVEPDLLVLDNIGFHHFRRGACG